MSHGGTMLLSLDALVVKFTSLPPVSQKSIRIPDDLIAIMLSPWIT
jgi:hypothetical protein